MGRVSKRRVDPEIEERVFEIFWDYLAKLKNPKDIQEFLISLLSHTEQVMLAKRLAIAILLARDYNYESIDQTLKVSKSTVGTVHKQLLIGAEGYKKAVKHILIEEKFDRLLNTIEKILLKLSLPKQYGSSQWEIKSRLGKKLAKKERKLSAL